MAPVRTRRQHRAGGRDQFPGIGNRYREPRGGRPGRDYFVDDRDHRSRWRGGGGLGAHHRRNPGDRALQPHLRHEFRRHHPGPAQRWVEQHHFDSVAHHHEQRGGRGQGHTGDPFDYGLILQQPDQRVGHHQPLHHHPARGGRHHFEGDAAHQRRQLRPTEDRARGLLARREADRFGRHLDQQALDKDDGIDRRRRHHRAGRPDVRHGHAERGPRSRARCHSASGQSVQVTQRVASEEEPPGIHPAQDPARCGRDRDHQRRQVRGSAARGKEARTRSHQPAAGREAAGDTGDSAEVRAAAAIAPRHHQSSGRDPEPRAAAGLPPDRLAMNAEIQEPLQRKLSFPFAKRHGVLVRGIANDVADTVCRPGVTPQALAEVRRFVGVPLKLERVSSDTFDSMLRIAYEAGSGAAMQMLEGLDDNTDLAHLAEDIPESSDLLESDDEAPIIRLINALLTQAVKENASDIHIEPYENRLVIRFRVDGVLREVLQTKRAVAPLVVSRIKVMSKLDIAERRLPQDGRISLRIAGRAVDVRVSTLPSGHGERVVLRLLDKQAGRIELTSLGMDPRTQETMGEIIHKPHGIILVTGPTGSGKTTTLYAALERINDNTRNVMTVEDPIEYYIDGIGQTQVNTKVEMTFARGLRAILRQDPDVVMVGEIRDLETAQIAVQASLTGHLVLSTLHTNTAVGAVTRLRDMGIEPFLLSSSLIGVLAQRLVRVLNPSTREKFVAGEYERRLLNLDPHGGPVELYRPSSDPGNGYRGRTGIYELIAVDDHMRTMIHDGSSEQDLERYARTASPGIRDDGRRKVMEGETTLEEVLRVTRED